MGCLLYATSRRASPDKRVEETLPHRPPERRGKGRRSAQPQDEFYHTCGRRRAGPGDDRSAAATRVIGLAVSGADARDYLLGVFPYALQTVGGISRHLETLAVHALPDDYFSSYLARIEAVSAGELLDCARAQLKPEEITAVAVGPADELRPQLEPHGEVQVIAAKAVSDGSEP